MPHKFKPIGMNSPIKRIGIKPVTPFIAKHEKECADCAHFIENIDPANALGYCNIHKEPTMNTDECNAFSKKQD